MHITISIVEGKRKRRRVPSSTGGTARPPALEPILRGSEWKAALDSTSDGVWPETTLSGHGFEFEPTIEVAQVGARASRSPVCNLGNYTKFF